MVSLAGLSRLGEHRVFFYCSMDEKKFLFVLKNALSKGAEPAQKPKETVLHLEIGAFEFYYTGCVR
jgi:hypothetical protein